MGKETYNLALNRRLQMESWIEKSFGQTGQILIYLDNFVASMQCPTALSIKIELTKSFDKYLDLINKYCGRPNINGAVQTNNLTRDIFRL